eukprot:gene2952-3394_t
MDEIHIASWERIRRWLQDDCPYGLIDLRSREEYSQRHFKRSTNIPLDELPNRIFELPPRGNPIAIIYPLLDDTSTTEAQKLRDTLVGRSGYIVEFVAMLRHTCEALWSEASGYLDSGNVSRMLWRACPLLEQSVATVETGLPATRYAIDIACGSGRDSLFLAQRGWTVTAVDHDPILLGKIESAIARYGIAEDTMRMVNADLEPVYIDPSVVDKSTVNEHPSTLPPADRALLDNLQATLAQSSPIGGYHLVNVARYLYRPLFPIIERLIVPGGFILFHTFMVPSHGKPKRPRFLLNVDELRARFATNFDIISYQETHLEDGRPVQCLLARRR